MALWDGREPFLFFCLRSVYMKQTPQSQMWKFCGKYRSQEILKNKQKKYTAILPPTWRTVQWTAVTGRNAERAEPEGKIDGYIIAE